LNFSLYIAKRYLRSKSSNNAINVITIIAGIGIVIGTAALFIVLSVFAGLKNYTLQFTSVVDPNLKAIPATGKSFILSDLDVAQLKKIDGIAHYAQIIEERVFVESQGKTYPSAKIKGVDQNYSQVVDVNNIVSYGDWFAPKSNQIVSGIGISNNLSLGVLDYTNRINIYVPKPGRGQIKAVNKAFNTIKVVNVGILDVNEDLNNTYIFASIALAKKLLNYKDNQVSALAFKLKENANISTVKKQIKAVTLILIIALFNVIGSIIMMILDKKKTLSTLYNIGVTIKDIRNIFFYQGSLMSIIGGVVGLAIGFVLVAFQRYGPSVLRVYITPSLAYPVAIKLENIIIVFFTISILGIIASKIASVRINAKLMQDL